jgi:protein-tyrosine-phosphatase
MTRHPVVLFLCVHNAGRSQMAAAFARRIAGGRVEVLCGGSEPEAEVQGPVAEVMREAGIDLAKERPRKFTSNDVHRADIVVTMGCGDSCPVFPGKRYEDWQVADPKGQSIDRVRAVRDALHDKVADLLLTLGVEPA